MLVQWAWRPPFYKQGARAWVVDKLSEWQNYLVGNVDPGWRNFQSLFSVMFSIQHKVCECLGVVEIGRRYSVGLASPSLLSFQPQGALASPKPWALLMLVGWLWGSASIVGGFWNKAHSLSLACWDAWWEPSDLKSPWCGHPVDACLSFPEGSPVSDRPQPSPQLAWLIWWSFNYSFWWKE